MLVQGTASNRRVKPTDHECGQMGWGLDRWVDAGMLLASGQFLDLFQEHGA